jgi:hypothetical protein
MKSILALTIFAAAAFAQAPQPIDASKARHFELEIKQVIPGQGALANGIAFTIAPGAKIPPPGLTTNGMPRINEHAKPVGQLIFIRDLANIADRDYWEGMLEPDGTFSYTNVLGAAKTVHAFKLSPAPDPVAAWWKIHTAQKTPFPPSALDQKPRR